MLNRRELLAASGGAAATAVALDALTAARAADARRQAIGFDAFTIFDPRSIVRAVDAEFPGRGEELGAAWRTKLFEYCWLRTLYRNYADFLEIADESLSVVFETAKIDLSATTRARLIEAWRQLKPWPDSAAVLQSLHKAGFRLATVSNFTPSMLNLLCENAGIAGLFEHQLSADRVQAYKPDPRAYGMAETAFRLPRHSIVFAAFGGWDAAGAKSFGLETFWVNRFNLPSERLGAQPDASGGSLADLASYVSR